MIQEKPKTLRLILGDQLNINHSWYNKVDHSVTYVLMEIRSETDYVNHHIQKVIGFFGAMRNFAEELKQQKHQVIYFCLNDENNLQSFDKNCLSLINEYRFTKFEYQLPDEYRLDEVLKSFTSKLEIPWDVTDTEHFYTERNELGDFFSGKKAYLMESFYRYMRKKHHVLIVDGDKPMSNKWNFDSDNRHKLPKDHKSLVPLLFENDLRYIEADIIKADIKTIGTVDSQNFIWPISRVQALSLLDFFMNNCLPFFGTYQDAMAPGQWSMYHSRLSFALNIKLLSPSEVIEKAIQTFEIQAGQIQFQQLEGFVRQIIGWREYMRGIYWLKMPEYASLNYFKQTRVLPDWYWTGNTKMNCMKDAIQQSLKYAYAHHIQRLMITGNFALLTGIHPDEIDAWYLGIYIDAIEWVEITNTRGMSQYADGGIVATKPYVSSAAYIHKMSSYCAGCNYDKSIKTGKNACPFNSLYWNFYDKHIEKLALNPRVSMMYNIWNKMQEDTKKEILRQADYYLKNINDL